MYSGQILNHDSVHAQYHAKINEVTGICYQLPDFCAHLVTESGVYFHRARKLIENQYQLGRSQQNCDLSSSGILKQLYSQEILSLNSYMRTKKVTKYEESVDKFINHNSLKQLPYG